MLLKEVRVLTDLQVISESRDTGVMCIRGTFQRAEEANHNKRVYPKAVLEGCVKSLQEKLSGRELVGELDHPADGVVKLQNASHLITKLEWKGNDLIGEAEILPTPAGQIAKSLINAGVKIGISSRGMGTLSESSEGAKIVNADYKMITFDLVADPSTKGAYPSLAESRQHALDFVENVIKPAISEKAFVARLKKKLDEAKRENNPWAICTAQVGREDKAKYERCVKKVKLENYSQDKKDAMELHASENRPTGEDLEDHPRAKKDRARAKAGIRRLRRKENSSRIPLTLPSLMEAEREGYSSRSAGPGETELARASLDQQTNDFLKSRELGRRIKALKKKGHNPIRMKTKLSRKLKTVNGRTIVPRGHPAEDSDAAENQRGTR